MTEKRLAPSDLLHEAERLYVQAGLRKEELELRAEFFRAFDEIDPEGPWRGDVHDLATEAKLLSDRMVALKVLGSKCTGHLLLEEDSLLQEQPQPKPAGRLRRFVSVLQGVFRRRGAT